MDYAEYLQAKNETRVIRDINGQQMLATIEASTTASKAYAVGDYMIANDKIYKVTAAIASGGTITVGTNVEEAKVGTELTELNRQLSDLESDNSITPNMINLSETWQANIDDYSTTTEGTVYRVANNTVTTLTGSDVSAQIGVLIRIDDMPDILAIYDDVTQGYSTKLILSSGTELNSTAFVYYTKRNFANQSTNFASFCTKYTDYYTLNKAAMLALYPSTQGIFINAVASLFEAKEVISTSGKSLEWLRLVAKNFDADDSIPKKALKNSDLYVTANPSLLLENAEVTFTTPTAGTYKSKDERHTLEDLNLSVGDRIYVTIDSQEGCLDSNIFSLEAYNGSTRLLQNFISKTSMETEMVIPEGTTRLVFTYRLCMTTSAEAGATATWSGVKLYYYVKEAGKKIIPSYYYIPNAITDTDIAELETKTERSLLFDTSVYGNADAAIEGAFSTVGRKKFLMLAWISDLHRRPFTGTSDAPVANEDSVFYNTVELVKYLNKRLPLHAVLDTGDIILGTQPFIGFTADVNFKYESEYIRSFNEACELYLYSPGNHDGYNANSVSLQDTEYQIGASVLNGKIESKQPGKCYYYIDYPDISTRLLVLAIPGGGTNLGMDAEQLQWLVSTGLGTVPDGYGVIMAYHIPTVCISYLEGGDGGFGNRVCFEGIVNAFHNHTTYSDSIVTADFSNKTNTKIVASLCGHMHFDEVSNPGELFTRDKGRDGTSKAGESLTNNLPCKQIMINATFNRVVDILIYVPEDNKIYTKRIGTGSNKEITVN